MRTVLALASLMFLVTVGVGCGDDTTTATADMAAGKDMTAVASDMAKLNCSQLLTCVQACTSQTCVTQCVAGASSSAAQKAQALAGCIFGACGPGDGGSGMCTSTSDTSQGCQTCEGSAVIGACNTEYSTCHSDM